MDKGLNARFGVGEDRPVFITVVHVETLEQAQRNVLVSRDNGADGAFLINHGMRGDNLLDIFEAVRTAHPAAWIGLNLLDRSAERQLQTVPLSASGVWTDGLARGPARRPEWTGLYFGGVAFKYQGFVGNAAQAAVDSIPFTDVVTTSGDGTGHAPDVGKIRAMHEALAGRRPLGIASGLTPQNVAEFRDIADVFLVATGISDSFTELSPQKVAAFAAAIR